MHGGHAVRVEQQRCADLLRLFGVQPLFPPPRRKPSVREPLRCRRSGRSRAGNMCANSLGCSVAKRNIRAATALKGVASLRVFADGLFKSVVRFLSDRARSSDRPYREVAENRLGRTVERLRNGSSVYRGHSLPGRTWQMIFQNHFPCNSLFGHKFPLPISEFKRILDYGNIFFSFRQHLPTQTVNYISILFCTHIFVCKHSFLLDFFDTIRGFYPKLFEHSSKSFF